MKPWRNPGQIGWLRGCPGCRCLATEVGFSGSCATGFSLSYIHGGDHAPVLHVKVNAYCKIMVLQKEIPASFVEIIRFFKQDECGIVENGGWTVKHGLNIG